MSAKGRIDSIADIQKIEAEIKTILSGLGIVLEKIDITISKRCLGLYPGRKWFADCTVAGTCIGWVDVEGCRIGSDGGNNQNKG